MKKSDCFTGIYWSHLFGTGLLTFKNSVHVHYISSKKATFKRSRCKAWVPTKIKETTATLCSCLIFMSWKQRFILTTSFFHTQLLWWERCAERNATRFIVSNLVSSWDYTIQCFPHYVTSECCFKCQPSSTTIQMDMFNCRKEKKKETTAASLERHLLHKQWVSNLKCTKKEP